MFTVEIKNSGNVWVKTNHTSDNVRVLGQWLYWYARDGYEVKLSYKEALVTSF